MVNFNTSFGRNPYSSYYKPSSRSSESSQRYSVERTEDSRLPQLSFFIDDSNDDVISSPDEKNINREIPWGTIGKYALDFLIGFCGELIAGWLTDDDKSTDDKDKDKPNGANNDNDNGNGNNRDSGNGGSDK